MKKHWIALLLNIIAFISLLIYQQIYVLNQRVTIDSVEALFLQQFATPHAKLLFAFMLLSPWWAVFITRKLKIFGNLVFILVFVWCIAVIISSLGLIKIHEAWLYWILYSILMLILGLIGILYQVLFVSKDTYSTNSRE